ncbi:hypothetical protein [Aquirufa sp.]|jgi:hypothetical protein|uniref:hypothetical protein n=1 Tax=Aquirufa sp. TaxID=2676249 RepID=UPI0037BED28A
MNRSAFIQDASLVMSGTLLNKPIGALAFDTTADLVSGHGDYRYEVFNYLRKQVPGAKLVIAALRPSSARTALIDKQRAMNALLQANGAFYIDLHSPFFLPEGSLRSDFL